MKDFTCIPMLYCGNMIKFYIYIHLNRIVHEYYGIQDVFYTV